MLKQVYNVTAAELRGLFVEQWPKLTDVERATWERCIESLVAFEHRQLDATHRAITTLQ